MNDEEEEEGEEEDDELIVYYIVSIGDVEVLGVGGGVGVRSC